MLRSHATFSCFAIPRASSQDQPLKRDARSIRLLFFRLARNRRKSNSLFATSLQLYLHGHTAFVVPEIATYTH